MRRQNKATTLINLDIKKEIISRRENGKSVGSGRDYTKIQIFQCMLKRTDAITNEVLEPVTFCLAYPTACVCFCVCVCVCVCVCARARVRACFASLIKLKESNMKRNKRKSKAQHPLCSDQQQCRHVAGVLTRDFDHT